MHTSSGRPSQMAGVSNRKEHRSGIRLTVKGTLGMQSRIKLLAVVEVWSSLWQPRGFYSDDIAHVLTLSRDNRMVDHPLWIHSAQYIPKPFNMEHT